TRADAAQKSVQEVEEALGVLRIFLRLPLAGPHLRMRRQDAADLCSELGRCHAGLRFRADLVELPHPLEEALCRRQVEAGERCAPEARRSAEVDEAGDPHA